MAFTAPMLIDAEPCLGGVELKREGERVGRLSLIEARRLAEHLLAAARKSEYLLAVARGEERLAAAPLPGGGS